MKKVSLVGVMMTGLFLAGCTSNQNELPESQSSMSTSQTSQVGSSVASDDTDDVDDAAEVAESTATSSQVTNQSTSASQGQAVAMIDVTLDEALQVVEDAYSSTEVTSVELEASGGTYYYEISGENQSLEYEVKVNAQTGELTKEEEETRDDDDDDVLMTSGILTVEEAAKRAVETVGQGEAIKWELDDDDDVIHWEVDVQTGRSSTSVKLDAQTGNVLETELDD
ncbi:MAG: PepSY domain-containing protein [Enterococcus sp.]